MKILYYNWIQFDKKNNEGGGVNIYQKNIIEELIKDNNNDIYFLSSGIYYNFLKKKAYIKKSSNIYGKKCKSYKIINSTCVAPAKAMYDDIDTYLNDNEMYELLKEFIIEQGGFDVIHFNNIEGLSAKCLQIKKDFPNIKIIYSLHNYYLFCPQVNLFYNNKCNCEDFHEGENCTKCLKNHISQKNFLMFYKIDTIFEKCGLSNLSKRIKLFFKKIKGKQSKDYLDDTCCMKTTKQSFNRFRKINVDNLNKYVDVIFSVSERVRNIAIKMGVLEDKVITNYIGTKFGENSIDNANLKLNDNYLTIAYMGYFDKIKGFDFLMNTLEKLPNNIAEKINFLCYAKIKTAEDEGKVEQIEKLNTKLHFAKHYNGYTHKELDDILAKINLGIVPVIWEDNLPQVAIEYAAHGVPVLASDLGGAQELSSSKYFVFKNNNAEDFTKKLTDIVNNKILLNDYFKKRKKLTTMKEHIDKLKYYYER